MPETAQILPLLALAMTRLRGMFVPWLGWTAYFLWDHRWKPLAALALLNLCVLAAYALAVHDTRREVRHG